MYLKETLESHTSIRMMVYRLFLFLALLFSGLRLSSQTPAHFFRSDTLVTLSGSKVSIWRDVLNESVQFDQALPNRQPSFDTNETGIEILKFQSSNNFMTLDSSITPTAMMIVFKLSDTPEYGRVIDRNVGNNCGMHLRSGQFAGRFDDVGSNQTLFSALELNYVAYSIITSTELSNATGRAYFSSFDLGPNKTWLEGNYQLGRNGLSFNGDVLEVSIFTSTITISELEMYEIQRLNYYSPPPNISDSDTIHVSNFCPTAISPGDYFGGYQWSNGEETDTIFASSTGWYKVTVEDMFQRSFSDSVYIEFPGSFISSFDLCINTDSLYTTNLEAFDVTWQDGSTDPNYLITEGGEYSLTVTDSEGCSYESDTVFVTEDFYSTEVELNEIPTFCLGNELFLASGFAEAEAYNWNTGEDTPFIQPTSSGEYWVEATNANGCVGRDTVVIDIAGAAPFVEFTAGTACVGNAVVFTDETFPEGSTVTGQEWFFDGQPFEEPQGPVVDQIFAEAGEYPVELTVTLATGCTGTGRDTVTVNPLPLVGFNFDEVVPCAGNEVAFESESGVPGNGEIASYAWTFGNGTSDAGIVGTTTFANLGVNTVQLAVTTTDGCVDSLLSNVVVLGSPAVDFTFDTVCVGMPTVFNEAVDVTESGPVFYNWQFGDGFFSNFPNTSHVFGAPGVYNVQLTATGNDFGGAGCVDQLTRQVRVYAAPEGNIETTDACLGEGVVFTDLTEAAVQGGVGDGIDTRAWVLPFGYGQGPVAVGGDSVQVWNALESGSYAVEMSFVTEAGCTGMATANVDVLAVPEASFSLEVPEVAPPFGVSTTNTSVDAQGYVWMIDGDVVSTAAEPELLIPDTGVYVVSLVATSGPGCNDTTSLEVQAINPRYDLALVDIRYVISGGRLTLRAVLGNNGNVPIREFELAVSLGLSAEVEAVMEFDLGAGEVREFTLPETFGYLSARDLPYVCMEVGLERFGIAEFDLENNGFCIGLEKEKAVFIDPYPNPAFDIVKVGYILPRAGTVELQVIDSEGRELRSVSWESEAGYTLNEVNVGDLSEGSYFLRYSYLGEEVVKRVVVVE